MKLTKNFGPNKFEYSVYGIGFDAHSQLSLLTVKWGKNVIFFSVEIVKIPSQLS